MDWLRILFDFIYCLAKVDILVDHKDASLTPEFNALNFVFLKGQLSCEQVHSIVVITYLFIYTKKQRKQKKANVSLDFFSLVSKLASAFQVLIISVCISLETHVNNLQCIN